MVLKVLPEKNKEGNFILRLILEYFRVRESIKYVFRCPVKYFGQICNTPFFIIFADTNCQLFYPLKDNAVQLKNAR